MIRILLCKELFTPGPMHFAIIRNSFLGIMDWDLDRHPCPRKDLANAR